MPPQPPPPAPPTDARAFVAALNARFTSGVAVRIFDLATWDEDWPERWDTCPSTLWCRTLRDRLSASVITRHAPYFFGGIGGGVVIAPYALSASLRCAWAYDAGTTAGAATGTHPVLPGCKASANEAWCVGSCPASCAAGTCAWAPESLDGMLAQQAQWLAEPTVLTASAAAAAAGQGRHYNELILDPPKWRATLPRGVEAFFFFTNDGDDAGDWRRPEAHTRAVRRDFLAKFDVSPQAVPLLRLTITPTAAGSQPPEQVAEGRAPFVLVDDTDVPSCGECYRSMPEGTEEGDCSTIAGCSTDVCSFCTNDAPVRGGLTR